MIYTDVCHERIGCVLLEHQWDGNEITIGYWARSFNAADHTYETANQICLAVAWAVLLLGPYLGETRFIIETDHDALNRDIKPARRIWKLVLWRLMLFEFKYDVIHRLGAGQQELDVLLRLPSDVDTAPLKDSLPILLIVPSTTSTSNDIGDNGQFRMIFLLDIVNLIPVWPFLSEVTTFTFLTNTEDTLEPTRADFLEAQRNDASCSQIPISVEAPGSRYSFDPSSYLIVTSPIGRGNSNNRADLIATPRYIPFALSKIGGYSRRNTSV